MFPWVVWNNRKIMNFDDLIGSLTSSPILLYDFGDIAYLP